MDARKCLNRGWFGPSHWSLTIAPNSTKSPTIGSALSSDQPMPRQSQMEGHAREIVEQVYYIDVTKCLLAIPANPLLQRQSCWIGSQAARNMSPCIHPALLPIKWQSANLTTIGQSKANWTQSWGHSKDISASKERVFHTDNTKCVNQGWLPNITPGHLKTNPSPTHNNN